MGAGGPKADAWITALLAAGFGAAAPQRDGLTDTEREKLRAALAQRAQQQAQMQMQNQLYGYDPGLGWQQRQYQQSQLAGLMQGSGMGSALGQQYQQQFPGTQLGTAVSGYPNGLFSGGSPSLAGGARLVPERDIALEQQVAAALAAAPREQKPEPKVVHLDTVGTTTRRRVKLMPKETS